MSAALRAAKSDASTVKTTWSASASALILVLGISFPASGGDGCQDRLGVAGADLQSGPEHPLIFP